MANKKILIQTTGTLSEFPSGSGTSATYFDDVGTGILYAKNITFNTMSFQQDGIIQVVNQTASLLPAYPFAVIGWDKAANGSAGGWKYISGQEIDVTGTIPGMGSQFYTASANADITGTFKEPEIKSLSNVTRGILSASNGGTGLTTQDFTNPNEYILLGNGTNKFTFLTASQATSAVALTSDGANWNFITQPEYNKVEITVFTESATWIKSPNTKTIRVLVQGAGGGGGSGANRSVSATGRCCGGGGGSSGAFVEKTLSLTDSDSSFNIIVGTGGQGALYPNTGSTATNGTAGNNGGDGTFSSFGNIIFAAGGKGGGGGSYGTTPGAGGASVTGSFTIYDHVLYGLNNFTASMSGGNGAASNTAGQTVPFSFSSTKYYISAGGAGGGNISSTVQTAGGNGGTNIFNSGSVGSPNARPAISSSVTSALGLTYSNFSASTQIFDLYIACGGGGGAGNLTGIGGTGSNGIYGSGGGGGGGTHNKPYNGDKQGGDGGNGYVAVISYKY